MPRMDTQTGALGPLPDQPIPTIEDFQTRIRDLDDVLTEQAVAETPQVSVPPAFSDLSPQQRLGILFGSVRGKERKASRPGKKSERQRRYERAARRAR